MNSWKGFAFCTVFLAPLMFPGEAGSAGTCSPPCTGYAQCLADPNNPLVFRCVTAPAPQGPQSGPSGPVGPAIGPVTPVAPAPDPSSSTTTCSPKCGTGFVCANVSTTLTKHFKCVAKPAIPKPQPAPTPIPSPQPGPVAPPVVEVLQDPPPTLNQCAALTTKATCNAKCACYWLQAACQSK